MKRFLPPNELAREAWRRNRPDISVTGNKTSVMVPIKGSIKGSDFKILKKTRTVVVTLPRAVSMVTMRVYNLKHPSFKKLWIDQDEANAQPADGTTCTPPDGGATTTCTYGIDCAIGAPCPDAGTPPSVSKVDPRTMAFFSGASPFEFRTYEVATTTPM